MFVPVWFTHAWSTGEGDLLGAYLHCTATTSFETVCKQFINGSVPFGYSLNSGFDTGYDSWFSSGAWQVGTPVQKMPAGTGALWVGESRGDPEVLFTISFWVWLSWEDKKEKKNSLLTFRKAEKESKNVHDQGQKYSSVSYFFFCPLTCTCEHSAKICMGGWSRSILVMPRSQLKSYHTDGLEQAPSLTKKRRHIIQPDYTGKLRTPLNKWQYSKYLFVHIWQRWTLRVIAQTWPFSRRGNGFCVLRFLS